MSNIILPKRVPALLTRRRSVDAPTAADVPTVDPAVARDPGLNVRRGAFGGGIGEGLETLGQTVSGIADDVQRAVARQNKLNDATNQVIIQQETRQILRDEIARREKEAEFADEPVPLEFNGFVDDRIDEAKTRARSLSGAAQLSDGAMARLDLDLDDMGQVFRDRGDTLHLQGVEQRGIDQLNSFVDEAAARARRFVGSAPGDEAYFTLDAELRMLDEAVAPFDGAFTKVNEQDIRTKGRTRIIEAAVTGMAEAGRGDEAKTLLQHDDFAGDLDQDTSARLTNNIDILSQAHDRDRTAREQREASEETSAKAGAAIAFTTDFRPRMATGEATHTEIAAAETDGVLTTAQADKLRADMAETGIAPRQAIRSLLGLAVTGEARGRIAAARELIAVFDADPTARDKVPPVLGAHAEILVQLADTDAMTPKEIVETAEAFFGNSASGDNADQPNAPLIQLAMATNNVAVQTDGQPDAQPGTASKNDVPPGVEAKEFRPDGRLRAGQNRTAEAVIEQEGNILRGGEIIANTDPRSSARRARDTLVSATSSADGRNEAIDRRLSGDDTLRDDNDEMFTEEQLDHLRNEEAARALKEDLERLRNPQRTSRTEPGPDNRVFAEMSSKKLEEFRVPLRESLDEISDKFHAKMDEVMAAQKMEEPIRAEVKKLGAEIHKKFGKILASVSVGLIVTGKLDPKTLVDVIGISKDAQEYERNLQELVIAHGNTMTLRKGEGKEIGADDLGKKLEERWLRIKELDAELELRKSEERR